MVIGSGSLVLSVLLCRFGAGALPAKPVPAAQTPAQLTPEQPTAETGEKRWYGWQLLLSDLTFVTVAVQRPGAPGEVAALAGLSLGAPLLHLANGNKTGAIVSATIRLLLVGFGAAVATDKGTCQSAACETIGDAEATDRIGTTLVIAALGLVFMVVDDTALARVAVTRPHADTQELRQGSRFSWAPAVAPTRAGATLALVGRF